MKNRFIITAAMPFLIFLLTGCISAPIATSFSGNARDAKDVASLVFDGNKMRATLSVYKVDGKTSTDPNTGSSYLLTTAKRTLNLQLLPGKHELEVALPRTKEVKLISADFKAGSSYEFIYEDERLSMVENIDGKQVPVNFQSRNISEYKEPGENEPHATLLEEGLDAKGMAGAFFGRGATTDGGIATYYRIDGLHGNHWWNVFVFFGDNEKITDKINIRVKPGIHTIEFTGSLGNYYTPHIISMKGNFEAGKKYTVYFDDDIKKEKTSEMKSLSELTASDGLVVIRLVEVK